MVSYITWQPKCRLILGVLCGWGEDAKLSFSCLIVGRPMQQKDTVQAYSEGHSVPHDTEHTGFKILKLKNTSTRK